MGLCCASIGWRLCYASMDLESRDGVQEAGVRLEKRRRIDVMGLLQEMARNEVTLAAMPL